MLHNTSFLNDLPGIYELDSLLSMSQIFWRMKRKQNREDKKRPSRRTALFINHNETNQKQEVLSH